MPVSVDWCCCECIVCCLASADVQFRIGKVAMGKGLEGEVAAAWREAEETTQGARRVS